MGLAALKTLQQPILKRFIQKPGVGVILDYSKVINNDKSVGYLAKKAVMSETEYNAKLSATSYQIGKLLETQFEGAKEHIEKMFKKVKGVIQIYSRPKSIASIDKKLKSRIEDANVKTFDDATAVIIDGEGNRIITRSLPELNHTDIKKRLKSMTINGRKLTSKEMHLLYKYIYNKTLTKEETKIAYPLFEKFAAPLIEKRSQPVVDAVCLGIAKSRINAGELTIQEIRENRLLSEELIHRLETDSTIQPLDLHLLNNYKGKHGLPEFSNRQIQSLHKITGGKVEIRSRSDLYDMECDHSFEYTKDDMKKFGIKMSGYRTAQMDIIHPNGAYGEIQFRGPLTNQFGEYEHITYDLRMEKNTLGPDFNELDKVIKGLTKDEYAKYNEYLEGCYNYYYRLELGLPAKKPKLPAGFNPILSENSLKTMYENHKEKQEILKIGFTPHFEEVA